MNTDTGKVFSDKMVANCTLEQARQLIDYDHFTVQVGGRRGIMLTYPWMERLVLGETLNEPLVLIVIFEHVEGHPPAPPEVQAVVDGLEFVPNPRSELE